ncbi:elongation factor P 5-aminopentanone reductase [Rossellomorea aquimaris]|uniref:elongation factor P 5-aminopentanone reductase n=1 Tax=Rossellomorea aquimaris TaxID=189382 RepID=UPI0007D060A0|nr:SDR family oxidoreductase [Rossellomorea aquimaris]
MKYALITGASGGIGRSTALQLAKEGWHLYLHYNKNKEAVDELIQKISKYNIEIIPIGADLSSGEGVKKIVSSIFQLDAIIYSSGHSEWGLFQEQSEESIDKMINVHVKSPMILIQKLLSKLIRQRGNIIIVSSIWGQVGAACEVTYSTVKGAQISFVKSLSKELALSGIRVNAVAPGAIDTNMLVSFSEEEVNSLIEEIPMGRLGQPDEIAQTILFLLSISASYITGQTIPINGGWHT